MRKIPLHWQIILGLIAGIIYALLSSRLGWSAFTLSWIEPWGRIFINLLKLIAVPLVLFSIISGIAGLKDATRLGRLAGKTLLLYLFTTVLAITVGLMLANLIKPGAFASMEQRVKNRLHYELWALNNNKTIKDHKLLLHDPQHAALAAEATKEFSQRPSDMPLHSKIKLAEEKKKKGPLEFLVDIVPSNIFFSLNDNSLMLQVIFFAIFFGVTLLLIPQERAHPLLEVIQSANEVFLKMVDVVMLAAPFFVFALMAGKIAEMAGDNPRNVIEIFKGLGIYALVVVVGLTLLLFIVYPLLITLFSKNKISYRHFFRGMGPAQLLAFSTSSSAATLPVTMECVTRNLGVSEKVAGFVLPIGATVNMDGTSLYQAVAVVFLAQFHLIELDLAQQLTVVTTAVLASIGAAAIPGAGLVMMVLILESVGLDPSWIAIILPVDRILDMCRTVVNVSGDAVCSVFVADADNQISPISFKTPS
ncbi:MAG: glutamate:proton symporter [Chitinophagales bacterium]|nr:MAG: glutamate:proton symporter [Chitinophagales bacterium]